MGAVKETAVQSYDEDFAAWAFDQAAALRRRDWRALDIPNLVEEVESMGRQQRAELTNRLAVLLMHLLKLDAQPERAFDHRSWRLAIAEQRRQIMRHLRDNPSLRVIQEDALDDAYAEAQLAAARETALPLDRFPEPSPWRFDEAMTRGGEPR